MKVGGCGFGTVDKKAAEKLKDAPWAEVVGAQTLYNEFNGNEVAANEQYKGKTIKVEGEVEEVKAGWLTSAYQILLRGRLGYAVRCYVGKGTAEDAKKLRAGRGVRVQGKCYGQSPLGHCRDVRLRRCDRESLATAAALTYAFVGRSVDQG